MLRTSAERTVVVKYLKRASGSLVGEMLSKREKVCFIGTGRGTSEMAPVYVGVRRVLPAMFCIWDENRELISGVMYEDRTIVWRMYRAWLSKYQVRTRLKSQPCASFGCRLRRWKM